MIKGVSIFLFVAAAIDAGWLCVWAIMRQMEWSTVVDNFLSDVGKGEVGSWHVAHVQSVQVDFGRVALQALTVAVLIIVAAILFANRKKRAS